MTSGQSKRARWAAAVLFVVDGVGFGIWAAHIPVFKEVLHLPPSALSKVLLALVIGSILTMPVAGQAIARFGSRVVIWLAATAYISAVGALGLVHSFWPLVFAAAAFGAAKGALDVSINAQGVWVERNIGKHIVSSFQGFWSVGGLFGAVVSSYLLRHGGGTHQDFLGAALVLLILASSASPLLLGEEPKVSRGQRLRMPDPGLLRLAGIAFLGLFAEGAMADWDGVYLKSDVGVSLSQAAIGYAAFSISMAAGRFAGDWLIARYRSSTILRASGVLLFLGLALALGLNAWWAAITGFILAGAGVANIVPVIWGAAGRNRVIGSGPALATVTTVGYFGFLAGPPLIGALATYLSLRIAMVAVALFGLAIAASSRVINRAAG